MTQPDAARGAALEAIWARHREGILGQVAQIERAVAALADDSLDAGLLGQAKAEAHKLAGSLGTFGFSTASEHARTLEHLLARPQPPSRASAPELSALVAALRADLASPSASDGTPQALGASVADAPLVLVIDDDRPLADGLAAAVERRGLRAAVAASPVEGRAFVARDRPALVLLDLTFEGETTEAYGLLSELTAAEPPIPVLVLTMRDVFTDRVEVARRGGRGFVAKSLSPEQVIDQVVQLIERSTLSDRSVLAVDDDPAVLDAIRALLEPEGLRVTTLSDPLRFWPELESARPDIVMLDVDMPHVNGTELCRVLRNDARWAATPVLFLTSRRDAETIRAGFTAGADDYLLKPVIGEELVVRVRNRLDRFNLHRFLAERDTLTGVLNRHSSAQGFERMLAMTRRFGGPLALATLDLDRFKEVNDRYGHAAGDVVLRKLGELLTQAFRGEDVVGRWGGEEFVVAMYGMDGVDAVRRLQGFLATFSRERFQAGDGREFDVTFSAGVAAYPADGDDVGSLQRAADAALYRAKAGGRGRVAAAADLDAAASARPDVVVVEDDDALGDLLIASLETQGFRPLRLSDGAEAAEALAGADPKLRPGVVLLDIELPRLDGVAVLRRMRSDGALRDVRAIMLTSRAGEDALLESLELGAFDHVAKPFSVPLLMHKVAQAMHA